MTAIRTSHGSTASLFAERRRTAILRSDRQATLDAEPTPCTSLREEPHGLDLLVVRLAARYGGIGQAAGLGDALIEAFGPEPAVARCAERLESAARLAARGSPRLEAHLWSTRSSFARLPPDQCRPDLIRSVQSLADPLLVDAVRRLTSGEAGS
jgi:hypothetical protein